MKGFEQIHIISIYDGTNIHRKKEKNMDCSKTGKLIAQLRKENGFTQQNLADALGITNKTVSKWECGLGFPDASLWPELSQILGVDIVQIMEGEITPNRPDIGNMNRIKFYVCPTCSNALISTGSSTIYCCGKKLEPVKAQWDIQEDEYSVEKMDLDYYVKVDHPMKKDNYILFFAYVKNDRVFFYRMYPEQPAEVRFPQTRGGKLYMYSIEKGLSRPIKL